MERYQKKNESTITSPEILRRKIKTTIVVSEGEIDFVGGSIFLKKKSGKWGFPILSRIPIIKNIFKKTNVGNPKMELVFFVNAKIINQMDDMSQIVYEVDKVYSEGCGLLQETVQ